MTSATGLARAIAARIEPFTGSAGGKRRPLAYLAATALSLAMLGTTTSAQAAAITFEAQGVLYNDYQANLTDTTGLFGTPGANLAGDAITITVTGDIGPVQGPFQNAWWYFAATIITVTVTNASGVSTTFADYAPVTANASVYLASNELYAFFNFSNGDNGSDEFYGYGGYAPGTNFVSSLDPTASQSYQTPGAEINLFHIDNTNMLLTVNVTEESMNESIPEPASIALFGAGLAGLGLVRRKRGGRAASATVASG